MGVSGALRGGAAFLCVLSEDEEYFDSSDAPSSEYELLGAAWSWRFFFFFSGGAEFGAVGAEEDCAGALGGGIAARGASNNAFTCAKSLEPFMAATNVLAAAAVEGTLPEVFLSRGCSTAID